MEERLMELRRRLGELLDEADGLNDAAEKEDRNFTEEEQTRYDDIMESVSDLEARIKRQEDRNKRDGIKDKGIPGGVRIHDRAEDEEIRNIGEFVALVLNEPHSPRLREYRQMAMGVGASGGFMVPEQFGEMLREISPQAAVVRPRAQVVPAGSPPDSAITFPALDQSGALGVYSGVTVEWIAEGAAKPATQPSLREIKLEPQEVAAHTPITDKLLRNAPAASSIIERKLRQAIIAAEDVAFHRGTGVGQPLGFVGHPGTIVVPRTGFPSAAPGDNYVDLVNMYTSVLDDGNPLVWLYSPTLLPELMTTTDVNGNLIWTTSAREGEPNRIMGLPAINNQRLPVMGNEGDLCLVSLQHYIVKDGSGIFLSASEHVRFLQNQTVIKAFWNVDGQPALTTPLLLEDGQTEVSPFVVLGA